MAEGYNTKTKELFVRAVDQLAASAYFVLDTMHQVHWQKYVQLISLKLQTHQYRNNLLVIREAYNEIPYCN